VAQRAGALGRQLRQHEAPVKSRGGAAIERDGMHAGVAQQQAADVMRPRRGGLDRRIGTARPRGFGEHIPDADPGGFERAHTLAVGQRGSGAEQRAHDRPEQVARMGVVLAGAQRGHPRQAAEHQDTRASADDRREGGHPRHAGCPGP